MQLVRKSSWHKFLPFFLGVLLLAVIFGLLSPATAHAVGGELKISGPGLNNPGEIIITQQQLRGNQALPPELQAIYGQQYLPQHIEWYSTINTWPTKSWYRGHGVKLTELFKLAGGLKPEATLIRFKSSDGFTVTFTVQELLNEPRYRFPNFIDYNQPEPDRYFGHIPGDPSYPVPVEPIIAHRSYSSHNIQDILGPDADDNFSRTDANHLLYGQRAVTQQTNARFAKYTTEIEVLIDPVPRWDNPTASVAPGEVPVGTLVELHSPFDDEDKVHYTLDGSDPTIHSPMYNWIASRWWSSREDVLEEINHPIVITEDTTIKAFVTGPGRADSEIVTFQYTVPRVAVTGVSIPEGNQELEVGETVQLTAVVQPENATDKSVTWNSDNEAVATVDETGLVTAVSVGTATITVTTNDGGFTDSINVTVVPDILLDIIVKENGVETRTVQYDLNEWEPVYQQRYSARDSLPAYRLGVAEGVFLEDILKDAEIDVSKITGFKFISTDGQVMPVSKSELLDVPRYYYPNIFGADQEEGAEPVKPMLALKSYVGARNNSTPPSWDSMDYLNTIRLFVGQKNPLDINYGLFAKWIYEIEVELDTEAPVWALGSELTADVSGSSVTLGWPEAIDNVGVIGYHIYQNDMKIDTVTGATRSYTVADLEPAEYTFGVKAVDAAGNQSEAITADVVIEPPAPVVLEITGPGVDNPIQYTMADLENMEQYRQLYSTINSWPTKKWYVAEGVMVRELLDMAEINDYATLIKFTAGDGYSATFRVEEIYGTQYLFPNFKEGGGDADGHIPGDPSGVLEVEPILALRSANSDNFDHMNTSNALHLIIGQRAVTEQTNEKFVKKVAKIEVKTDPVPKWEQPQASLPSGTVAPGTKIELSTSDMNGDKIYYTTDGSIPTMESTMYNPIAKRWWSSRGPEAVAEINRPIEITEDTIIKAIAIGIGKRDSDVVTFEYHVLKPKYAVTLSVEPAGGGSVIGAGEYYEGDSVTVEAQAAEGYAFVNWTDAEGEVSTEASYTFTMPAEAVSLTANFRPLEHSHYSFDYDVPAEITEGQDVEVAVTFESVEVKDLGYDGVRFKFSAEGPGDVTFSATDSQGVEHTFTNEGYWGPAGGFDLPAQYSATTDWTLNFAEAGEYTITFSLIDAASEEVIAGLTESMTVEVESPVIPVIGVSITEGDQELEVGETVQLTAVVQPENATDKSVTWSSSDDTIATVDETGLVTAVAAGEATITVTTADGGFTDSITVTVVPPSDFVVVDGVLVEYRGAGGDVVIPDDLGITSIGEQVFRGLNSLTSVVIPDGTTRIEKWAFRDCKNLTNITIPGSVTFIGASFEGCSSLREITIPEGVTSIEPHTFTGCTSLTSVTIPESVESIGLSAFNGCSSLTNIILPEGIKSIESQTFYLCSSLAEITIPEGVKTIGTRAFEGCTSLTNVTLPSSLTLIDSYAFNGCGSLKEVIIPEAVTKIGMSAFQDCTSLESATFLNRSTSITFWAFRNCPSVTFYGYRGSTAQTYANNNGIPFVPLDPLYAVTLNVNPAGGGSVIGAGEYAEGESVTVEAQAAEGYVFVNWTDVEGEVSTEASYTFTMPAEAVSLTANFRLLEHSHYAFAYEVPEEIVAGEEVEVAVTFESVEVKDLGYDGVRFKFSAEGPGDVTFSATDSQGVEHTFTNEGYWGPAGGFDLPAQYSATTDWTLNFAEAGEYTITFSLIDAASEEVIAGLTDSVEITVKPAEPQLYTVTFVVTDGKNVIADAVIQVKDSAGAVVAPEADGTYRLAAGDYSYTVTKEGFKDVTGTFTVVNEDITVEVILEKAVEDGKEELREAIDEALSLEQGGYTPSSWQSLQNALRTAQAICALEHATQAAIDQALARLEAAMAQLVEKADKTALEAAINEARSLNPADYTSRSWRQVSNMLLVAERVYQDANASQEEVDQAAARLNDALNALVEV